MGEKNKFLYVPPEAGPRVSIPILKCILKNEKKNSSNTLLMEYEKCHQNPNFVLEKIKNWVWGVATLIFSCLDKVRLHSLLSVIKLDIFIVCLLFEPFGAFLIDYLSNIMTCCVLNTLPEVSTSVLVKCFIKSTTLQ